MNELPKVYANKIDNTINNTQDIFYSSDRGINKKNDNISVIKKINNIFASKNHVYKSDVNITLKNNSTTTKTIIGKNSVDLITIEGEHIKIIDIIDIEKI